MSIIVNDGFEFRAPRPGDSRTVKDSIAERNAIPVQYRFRGLQCFVIEEQTTYILKTGITNDDWIVNNSEPVDTSKWELEVGVGLRIPTDAEWEAERLSWGSNNAAGAFGSSLKLSMGGYRDFDGEFNNVSLMGHYWSSTVFGSEVWALILLDNQAFLINGMARNFGNSARLIVDGTFTQQQFDNNYGGQTIEINGLPYGYVYNDSTQKIWLDRNLGATQVATSSTDAASYGWLYQWGRLTDGHQERDSDTTATLSSGDVPGNDSFITNGLEPQDWRDPQNDNLWQGVDGINTPAPPASVTKLIGKNGEKASYLDLLDLPDIPEPTPLPQGIILADASVPFTAPQVGVFANNLDELATLGQIQGFQIPNEGFNSNSLNNLSDLFLSLDTDGNGIWMAVGGGNNNGLVISLDDGNSWFPSFGLNSSFYSKIVTDRAGTWIAVQSVNSGRFRRSTDNGGSWTSINPGTMSREWHSIATNRQGIWIGVARNESTQTIAKSIDNGVTWSTMNSPQQLDWQDIASGSENVWIAVAQGPSGSKMMRSVDNGDTWQMVSLPVTRNITKIDTDNNGTWVAISFDNSFPGTSFLRSTDNGENWDLVGVQTDVNVLWNRVVSNKNGYWMAVGSWSDPNNQLIARSYDNGETWTALTVTPPRNWRALATDEQGKWMAVRNGGITDATSPSLYIVNDTFFTKLLGRHEVNQLILSKGYIKDAPQNSNLYARINGGWQQINLSGLEFQVGYDELLVFDRAFKHSEQYQWSDINYSVSPTGNLAGATIEHVIFTNSEYNVVFGDAFEVSGAIAPDAYNLIEFKYASDDTKVFVTIKELDLALTGNPVITEILVSNNLRNTLYVTFDRQVVFQDTTGITVSGGFTVVDIRTSGINKLAIELDTPLTGASVITASFAASNTITDTSGNALSEALNVDVINGIADGVNVKSWGPGSPFNNDIWLSNSMPYTDSQGTISFWLKMDQLQNVNEEILGFSHDGPELVFFGVRIIGNVAGPKIRLNRRNDFTPGSSNRTAETQAIITNNLLWHHVTIVSNMADVLPKIYIDGVEVTVVAAAGVPAGPATWMGDFQSLNMHNPKLTIGSLQFNGSRINYLRNKIDQLVFWNVELTQAEITELYNAGAWLDVFTHSRIANTVSVFEFDDSVVDLKGFIQNPQIHGGPNTYYSSNIP